MTDETKEAQDNSSANGTTSVESFTKEQVDQMVSNALAKAGRDAKSLSVKEETLSQREAELVEKERQAALAEEEAVKNDPQKLNVIRERRALKEQQIALAKQRAEIEKERKEIEDQKLEAQQFTLTRKAEELAQKYGVSKDLLLLFDSVEKMEKAIEKMPKGENKGFQPDSGRTFGQGIDISKLTPAQKIMYGLEHQK